MIQKFQLGGIVSLHMVSPSTTTRGFNIDAMFNALTRILPIQNLRVVDVSNCNFILSGLASFLTDCFSLEQITYNTIHEETTTLNITGTELTNCSSLTELYMDNSTFRYYNAGLSNLENEKYSKTFLFWRCRSKVLRNVSIKNATYNSNYPGQPLHNRVLVPLPQKALIKFVRNGPASLRYFRSDLTPANMEMLRLERPDIIFS